MGTALREDELNEDAVRAALKSSWLGRPYHFVDSVDSTNDQLKRWAADPAVPSGTVLLTEHQSAGRGRLNRRWEAPSGTSLLFSVLLRPGWPARRAVWLTMLAGLAVVEAIEATTGLHPRLKWPNDVVLGEDQTPGNDGGEDRRVWRKVGGLLLDATFNADGRLESAIPGIGLNVNIPAEALPHAFTPATSLLVAGGRPVPRRPLLVALLECLERHYDAAASGQSPWHLWNERLITLGRTVQVTAGDIGTLVGLAEGTDEWGQLLVRDEAGKLHAIAAGDVTLRGH